jgi:hypothetical protein
MPKLGICRVVPDSSIFVAGKPCKTTYSYEKLSVNRLETIRELLKRKTEHSRTDDVSMTIDQSLFE